MPVSYTHLDVYKRQELPLALPFIGAGIRTSAIEVVATSTLAAYVSYSDLGTYVLSGLASQDNVEAFSGSILVALLAGLVAVVLGRLQRALTPAPLRAAGTSARVSLAAAPADGRKPLWLLVHLTAPRDGHNPPRTAGTWESSAAESGQALTGAAIRHAQASQALWRCV